MVKRIFSLLLCIALCSTLLPIAARADVGYRMIAAVSAADRDSATEALDVLPGDTVTVTVSVEGGAFVGAACRLTYDTERFVLDALPTGWAEDADSKVLAYFHVNGDNVTVLGTLTFLVKSAAAEGVSSFTLSDTYVAADWSEGYSNQPAEECDRLGGDVNILGAKAVRKEATEYVAGYSLVLVYTDDGAEHYAYDGAAMIDVTAAGYLYPGISPYAHVYALVVSGQADLSKVTASASGGERLSYSLDVNGDGRADPADAEAVQSVYNTGAMEDRLIVLRADVNGDKQVDIFDAAVVLSSILR